MVCKTPSEPEIYLTRTTEIGNDMVERGMMMLREIVRVDQTSLGDNGNRGPKLQLVNRGE